MLRKIFPVAAGYAFFLKCKSQAGLESVKIKDIFLKDRRPCRFGMLTKSHLWNPFSVLATKIAERTPTRFLASRILHFFLSSPFSVLIS